MYRSRHIVMSCALALYDHTNIHDSTICIVASWTDLITQVLNDSRFGHLSTKQVCDGRGG